MIRSITAGYFAASGTSLRAGRLLEDDERLLAAVVSEALARRMWPDEPLTNIVGHQFRQDGNVSGPLVTIVGVVEDARAGGVDREPLPTIYRPHGQWASGPMTLVVKTAQDPAALSRVGSRRNPRGLIRALPIPAVRTMREIVSSTVAQRRFQLVLTSLFALVALLLSAVGLYGVVSYAVACRTRDIGLRMALGAVKRDVMQWVFSHGMRPVVVGLAVGLGASIAIARTLRSLLFGITPADPLSIGGVVLVLMLTSGLACYLPARRAAALIPSPRCDTISVGDTRAAIGESSVRSIVGGCRDPSSGGEITYATSGLVRLTKPQLIGTLVGLMLAALLAAIDQTIVGTAEPRIIASLSGFDRYPWVATAYLLTSTLSVPIFASLSDIYGRKPFFLLGAIAVRRHVGAVRRGRRRSRSCRSTAWAS